MIIKLNERDNKLFKRIIKTTQLHDMNTSRILSKELAEIRKTTKILGNTRNSIRTN